MKTTLRNGKSAFTLVELMTVITVIVLLAALVVGGLVFSAERQAKEKAKIQIALLSKALEEYKLDMGTYPPTNNIHTVIKPSGTGNSELLYQALFYDGYNYIAQGSPATWTKAKKIYLHDLDPTATEQGWVAPVTGTNPVPPASTPVLDPWGNRYCYRTALTAFGTVNSATQNPEFDLWSMGKDGLSVPATPPHIGNRDDIKNF